MGPWNGCPKYDLSFLAAASYKGDLDGLEMLLFTGDAENKFPGDINTHVTEMTPLMYAAQNGQLEAVEMLLKAKADPHMRRRVKHGEDARDGMTAKDMALQAGWDEVAEVLEQAEKVTPAHRYKRYGRDNNTRLHVYVTGESGHENNPFAGLKNPNYAPRKRHSMMPSPITGDAEGSLPVPVALPPTTVALLFPGQGSQYVKMLSGLKENAAVIQLVAKARSVLGYNLLEVCLGGPEDRLGETSICQPAMFLAGMAGVEKLRQQHPEAVENPGAVAGLSLGEYTALCTAGVFTFEEGMELVRVRGAAMAEAAKARPQAMLSVAGLEKDVLQRLCEAQATGGEVCQIANCLFPKGFACAGTADAICRLEVAAKEAGCMQARMLKTSGAFHTPLMQPAQVKLEAALQRLAPHMRPPRCDVYMNVTGGVLRAGTPPAELIPLLAQQLCSPVLWDTSMRAMIDAGLTDFYEVGPMKQLKAMMKRIDASAWSATSCIEV